MTKQRFIGFARVSSREQEREGFSLDVQESGLLREAERRGGAIVKMFRVAETATRREERTTFREMLSYAKKHRDQIDGIIVYKLDRAARNLKDYMALEDMEEQGLELVVVTQPTENTPAGRMMRRTLANFAAFQTEQQSLDVREGQQRRVKSGLFLGAAPFGYRNVRVEKRAMVEVDAEEAAKLRRIFELYAYHRETLDSLTARLESEAITYLPSQPRFNRSTLYRFLTDRSYIGEIRYQGQWHPGTHTPLIDRTTWDRVQTLLGGHRYQCHDMLYASELILCGHCQHPVTGEKKIKKTKTGDREYVYYRCTKYTAAGHPRTRLPESALDEQVLALFTKLRVDDEEVRDWFVSVLRAKTHDEQQEARERLADLTRQLSALRGQQNELLNLRLLKEVDSDTYTRKATELRDREGRLKVEIDACDLGRHEQAELAIKAFELSQSLTQKWDTADIDAKRRILEILWLNCTLVDVSLVPEMRKPFDLVAEGLLRKDSRAGGI